MADQEKIIDHLDAVFCDLESRLNGKAGGPVHTLNKSSFAVLKQVQFPDRRHEDWKYTAVQRLISPKYKLAGNTVSYNVPDISLESYVIPILNGKILIESIDPALTRKGLTIQPLHEAIENSAWKSIFSRWVTPESPSSNQAFELLNFAFQSGGFMTMLNFPFQIRCILYASVQVAV
jgi:SufBD protein N-terminal region